MNSWLRGLKRGAGTNGDRWDPWAEDCSEDLRRRVAPVAAWKAINAHEASAGWVTRGEAMWVARVASVLPDLAPEALYRVARAAIDMGDDATQLRALDIELMLYLAMPEPTGRDLKSWQRARASNHIERAMFHRITEQLTEQLAPVRRATDQLVAALAPYPDAKAKAEAAGLDVSDWTPGQVIEWARQQEGRS